MGDFLNLIENIHQDKEQFSKLVITMNPLINKYTRMCINHIKKRRTLNIFNVKFSRGVFSF